MMKIYAFDRIGSTNDFAESLKPLCEDAVITARVQTNGHGTKGRSFCSDEGGLYLTKLTFYRDFPAAEVFRIMIDSSVAVCRTLEAFGLQPKIKWPNDIWVNGKKICGMLINNTFRGDKIACSIVGIGLNIENEFPPELNEIAISMKQAGAIGYSWDEVKDLLTENLQREYSVAEYKRYLFFLGERISLLEGEKKNEVVALDVDERGRLKVADENGERFVSAAEVSMRIS